MPIQISPRTEMERRQPDPIEPENADEDAQRMRDLLGFAWRAPKRRPKMSVLVLLLVGTIGISLSVLWPKTYTTDVRILAKQNLVLPALDNPNRAVPREADNPTKNVSDVILRHDNLVGLVKKLALLDRWESERPALYRYKDRVTSYWETPPSVDDRTQALVAVLEKRIKIVTDDATISITVEWTNAQTAYDIAQALQKDFLDARYDADVSTINDAISILEQHAADQHKDVDEALKEFERLQGPTTPLPSTDNTAPRITSPIVKLDPIADKGLQRVLDEKRAALAAAEQERQHEIQDLQRKLSEALVTYTPQHPTVVALQDRLDAAKREAPELAALKRDEATLATQLGAVPRVAPTGGGSAVVQVHRSSAPQVEDPSVSVGRVRLQNATRKYAELEERIDAARIELDVAKAAFKYRFSIVRPADVPKKPIAPKTPLLLAGSIALAFILAFAIPFLLDVVRGRFSETWQVERRLKVPVLGEMDVT